MKGSKKRNYKWVFVALPSIASVLIGIVAVVLLVLRPSSAEGVISISTVGLIATLVGIWVAVNISNNIEKDRLEELEDEVEKSQKTLEQINKDYRELSETAIDEIAFLLRGFSDEPYYAHLANQFETKGKTISNLRREMLCMTYASIRMINVLVENLCNVTRWEREPSRCAETINTCGASRVLIGKFSDSDYVIPIEVQRFLDYLSASFCFYAGFASEGEKRIDQFRQAASTFEKYYENEIATKAEPKEVSYFGNIIAQCYSEMLLINNKVTNVTKDFLENKTKGEHYTRIALSGSTDPCNNSSLSELANSCHSEMYLKNAGVFCDRVSRCDEDINKSSAKRKEALKLLTRAAEKSNGKGYYATYYSIISVLYSLLMGCINEVPQGSPSFRPKDNVDLDEINGYMEQLNLYLGTLNTVRPTSMFYCYMRIIESYFRCVFQNGLMEEEVKRIDRYLATIRIIPDDGTPLAFRELANRIDDAVHHLDGKETKNEEAV